MTPWPPTPSGTDTCLPTWIRLPFRPASGSIGSLPPRLSLEVYAQPLLSSGRYTGFKELARPRSYAFTAYPDPAPTTDPDRIVVDPDGARAGGRARDR